MTKQAKVLFLIWIPISGAQFIFGILAGVKALALFTLVLALSQFTLLIFTFRTGAFKDEEKLKKIKNPNVFIRSSYVKCSAYLFISAAFEAFLIGRVTIPPSAFTSFLYEAWIGHICIVGAGILRYWSLSLGPPDYSA